MGRWAQCISTVLIWPGDLTVSFLTGIWNNCLFFKVEPSWALLRWAQGCGSENTNWAHPDDGKDRAETTSASPSATIKFAFWTSTLYILHKYLKGNQCSRGTQSTPYHLINSGVSHQWWWSCTTQSSKIALYSVNSENNNWLQLSCFALYIMPHLCSEGGTGKPWHTI